MSWLSYSSLVPPNLFILLALVGVLAAWWRKPLGLAVATGAIGCLYLVSMPLVAGVLMRSTQTIANGEPALPAGASPGAIIVLATDARYNDGEPEAVGPLTLERLARGGKAAASARVADPGKRRATGPPRDVAGGADEQGARRGF